MSKVLFSLCSLFFLSNSLQTGLVHSSCKFGNHSEPTIIPQNNCLSFSVSQGTGCAWMCSYCANNLGTNNYYFTDGVCKYEGGGCAGNPLAGKTYTCCSN